MAPASKPTRSGAEHSDAFHRLIDTWPLPTTVNRPLIRLYFEEGRIVALVGQGSRDGIQLWTFDTTGRLLSEENLLGFSPASDFALAYARTTSGRRLFALGNGGHYEAEGRTDDWDFVLVAPEPDGQLLLREHALSTEGFPAPAAETQRQILGEVALLGGGKFGRVKIATADRVFFADDFADFPANLNGWNPNEHFIVREHPFWIESLLDRGVRETVSRSDSEWRNFYLETEVIASSIGVEIGAPAIQIGGDTFSSYTLRISLIDALSYWRRCRRNARVGGPLRYQGRRLPARVGQPTHGQIHHRVGVSWRREVRPGRPDWHRSSLLR